MCTIMDMPEGSDPVKYFGRAFEHYAKVPGRPARMLATRSMMLCAAFQAAAGRWVVLLSVFSLSRPLRASVRAALRAHGAWVLLVGWSCLHAL